jgi:hypothetical protein
MSQFVTDFMQHIPCSAYSVRHVNVDIKSADIKVRYITRATYNYKTFFTDATPQISLRSEWR